MRAAPEPAIRDRAIAAGLLLSILGSVGFMVAYAKQESTQWEGFALACAFGGFMIAALGWSQWILPHEQVVDVRDTYPQPLEERAGMVDRWEHGIAVAARRTWLLRMLYAALGVFGVAALFPVGSLGPEPDDALFHTRWKRGVRLQRADGSLVRAGDLNDEVAVTVFPEGSIGDSQSMTILVKLPDGLVKDAPQGYIAYSKMCTHAGCPVALYRSVDHRLICPCHQSAFDVTQNASVVSGPADHALPRLPIEIASDGYLRATGDFPEPVGPGFWEHS
ncbi:MAG TPA: Rieske 2Fe-2S domain-containing protein [Candidatus Baltobacteraceae bacterium]|nr:Rieske 2Fe-2S domain-containing protein [Candidatus Baltobacteraceae bacterium]